MLSDAKVVLFALGVAALTAAGVFFQKLNGVRGGSIVASGWLILAVVCFVPTFFIANKVFLTGGRVSLFVPATAVSYVMSMLIGRFYFNEAVSWNKWIGGALILAGIGVMAGR